MKELKEIKALQTAMEKLIPGLGPEDGRVVENNLRVLRTIAKRLATLPEPKKPRAKAKKTAKK